MNNPVQVCIPVGLNPQVLTVFASDLFSGYSLCVLSVVPAFLMCFHRFKCHCGTFPMFNLIIARCLICDPFHLVDDSPVW